MPDTFTSRSVSLQRPTARACAITPNKKRNSDLFSRALNISQNGTVCYLTTVTDTVGLS